MQAADATEESRARARRGAMRGPFLAQVELAFRALQLMTAPSDPPSDPPSHPSGTPADPSETPPTDPSAAGSGPAREAANGHATVADGEEKGGEGGAVPELRRDVAGDGQMTLGLSILAYYKRLGHTLSCAVDLR